MRTIKRYDVTIDGQYVGTYDLASDSKEPPRVAIERATVKIAEDLAVGLLKILVKFKEEKHIRNK